MQCVNFPFPLDAQETASNYGRLRSEDDFVNLIANFDLDTVDIDG